MVNAQRLIARAAGGEADVVYRPLNQGFSRHRGLASPLIILWIARGCLNQNKIFPDSRRPVSFFHPIPRAI